MTMVPASHSHCRRTHAQHKNNHPLNAAPIEHRCGCDRNRSFGTQLFVDLVPLDTEAAVAALVFTVRTDPGGGLFAAIFDQLFVLLGLNCTVAAKFASVVGCLKTMLGSELVDLSTKSAEIGKLLFRCEFCFREVSEFADVNSAFGVVVVVFFKTRQF